MRKQIIKLVTVAIFATTIVSSAIFAEDGKTAKEWITILTEKAFSPEQIDRGSIDYRITIGAYLAGTKFCGSQATKNQDSEEHWENCYLEFRIFMSEGGGRVLFNEWLKDKSRDVANGKYHYIFNLLYLGESDLIKARRSSQKKNGELPRLKYAYTLNFSPELEEKCLQYRDDITERGISSMKKGYSGKLLTEQDVEDMRLYRMYCGTTCMTGKYMPSDKYIKMHKDSVPENEHAKWNMPFKYGEKAPDFKLLRLEPVLKWATYTDVMDDDLEQHTNLGPDSVLEFLWIIDKHKPVKTESGEFRVFPDTMTTDQGKEDDYLHLAQYHGKKAVYILFSEPSDYAGPQQLPQMETLYQAYKDKVEFIYIAHTIRDWPHTLNHVWNQEERARRTKALALRYPAVSFPWVLEDLGQTAESAYSRGYTYFLQQRSVLMDIDGRVVSSSHSCGETRLRVNHLERELKKLMLNNWKYNPSLTDEWAHSYSKNHSGSIGLKDAKFRPSYAVFGPENETIIIEKAKVTSINTKNNTIEVTKKMGDKEKTYTVQVGDNSRIVIDRTVIGVKNIIVGSQVDVEFMLDDYYGKDNTMVQRPKTTRHTIKERGPIGTYDLQSKNGSAVIEIVLKSQALLRAPGDKLYRLKDDSCNGNIKAVCITGTNDLEQERSIAGMWMSGKIMGVNLKNRTVTVLRIPASAKAMRGYRLWKDMGGGPEPTKLLLNFGHIGAGNDGDPLLAINRLNIVDKWIRNTDEKSRTYTFKIDDAAQLILDGEYDHMLHEVKVGDCVGIRYHDNQENNKVIYPDYFRVSNID
jgi:hypothetical protein